VETGARKGGNWNEEGWKLERGRVETGIGRVETGARKGGNWNEEGWKLERGRVETGTRKGGNWSEEGWKLERGRVETGTRKGGNWSEEGWKLERGRVETGARKGGNWNEEGWKLEHWNTLCFEPWDLMKLHPAKYQQLDSTNHPCYPLFSSYKLGSRVSFETSFDLKQPITNGN
jgi:hypothetical protein